MDADKIRRRFNESAGKYDAGRGRFIPCFDDFYDAPLKLLYQYKRNFRRIADLGAGTGLLSARLYKLYPDAEYVLTDVAEAMLAVARERFAGLPNFAFVTADYTRELPEADLICSALSIHHLDEGEKARLYRSIYEKLPEGGVFLNLDEFRARDPAIDELYSRDWLEYVEKSGLSEEDRRLWLERKKFDKENSMEETVGLLRAAGFRSAEGVYQNAKFGAALAVK
ncbi:MAG: class I SAM-dependent methyltransferase [Clostridiales bacterium]|jgi:SAM-dependent methyltransferase|nr:class I SAM-dependent methyltransferase [Clostridiales bacterium]